MSNQNQTASSIFTAAYNGITREVPFQQEWNNGTGYLDGIVKHDFNLPEGTMLKCFSGVVNRRRIIIIVMPEGSGNVAVFDRFTDGHGEVFVHNMPTPVAQLFDYNSNLNDTQMAEIIGELRFLGEEYGNNIGFRIAKFFDGITRFGTVFDGLVKRRSHHAARNAARKSARAAQAQA